MIYYCKLRQAYGIFLNYTTKLADNVKSSVTLTARTRVVELLKKGKHKLISIRIGMGTHIKTLIGLFTG